MSTNKLISSINALVNNVKIPSSEINNVVCIDTVKNRIGVKTSQPEKEIDVSGTIKANYLNITNDVSASDLYINNIHSYNNSNIKLIGDLNISRDIVIDGSCTINGQFFNISDDRYKHNEKSINNGLKIIRKLKPQIYEKTRTFKTNNFIGHLSEPYILEAGLIAQEVNDIDELKFTVLEGNNKKPYYLNYNNIFVYSIASIKELDKNLETINENVNKNLEILNEKVNKNSQILAENVSDISNINRNVENITKIDSQSNLGNIENYIIKQNELINSLNLKIKSLEKRINKLTN